MIPEVTLDDSQARVVEGPAETRQIVLAGPGAGKTEVVGRLAEHLVRNGLYPEEILVISFSRAAVDVMTRRTHDVVEEGRRVDIGTIDSLAARVVIELSETDPEFRGFERTIRRATDLLRDTENHPFGDIGHVVIDEVQDVVGLRARFALALLEVVVDSGAGFTLLGDPLQSVYDFQLEDDVLTCAAFLDEVRRRYQPVEHVLTGEYRTRSADARAAALARTELASLDPVPRLGRLAAMTADLSPLGALDEDAVEDISLWSGSTVFLCDTNIRAALVAQRAAALGLPVELAPGRVDPALPSWLGDLLQDSTASILSRDDFLQLADGQSVNEAASRWRLLLEISRARRDVNLRDLGAALQSVSRTRAIDRPPSTDVVASTVHRSKGLEFENVVLVDPEDWSWLDDEDASSRRLFVALSRSRRRLTRLRGIKARGWCKERCVDGSAAWVQRPPRQRGRARATGILLEAWMARALGPTRASISPTVGAALTWERGDDYITVDGNLLPSWTAYVDGMPVARTGETFGQLVAKLFDPTLERLPRLLGGRVEGVETVVGPPSQDGPGRHGFWTGARVTGPLNLEWNK